MPSTKQLFYEYNPWWDGGFEAESLVRRSFLEDVFFSMLGKKPVVFLTGLRRVGKTTLMKLGIAELIASGVKPEHILYVSVDDYLLREDNLDSILTQYRQLHRLTADTKLYLFFDEITYQQDFQQQLKNLYDRTKHSIVVSSSSSSALRDGQALLTGRWQHIEVNPLSFEEFLSFRNIKIKGRDADLRISYFEEYLQVGGMPEYVLNQDRNYLTTLLEDIIHKDIIAYHKLRDISLVKGYFHLLMERAGKQISINKVAKILSISPDTARRYLHLFEESFLINLVPRYGKTNEQLLAPKKIYAADLGIRHLFTGFRDKGAVFENYVYSLIKHKRPSYVYQDGTEIDFFTEDKTLMEVKYGQVMKPAQKTLFEQFPAKKKLVIGSMEDALTLLSSH